jgi:hypothetical protein
LGNRVRQKEEGDASRSFDACRYFKQQGKWHGRISILKAFNDRRSNAALDPRFNLSVASLLLVCRLKLQRAEVDGQLVYLASNGNGN